jgi:hypothetical protein
MDGFAPCDPVQYSAIDRFPARERAVAAAARGFLGIRARLEQAADPPLRVVDRSEDGMIAVNPIASATSLIFDGSFVPATMMLAPSLGIL